ncbi:unnamed protein product [Adineta steineri]|uniref:Cysteine dioxygenase n=1 Tax=Adineta steineri TaxID=433720 RepID=A0A814WAY0_9BILA|nr:unnamed protein product [Adineta steineri]CAF1199870.1 unnamed protein product [Adineta steineri]
MISPVGIRNKYWLSIDKTAMVIKCGWGEPRPLLTAVKLDSKQPQLQSLQNIYLGYTGNGADRTPVDERSNQNTITDIQQLIKEKHLTIRVIKSLVPSKERSLRLLPLGVEFCHEHEIPRDISWEVAELYNSIAYYKAMIDRACEQFPQFIETIRRSISHPNGACGKTLDKKAKLSSFGLPGTYLRITFGEHYGNSPGHRFVLEIWPKGHFSPIHQHADAHGVIMVYHGHILISLYAALDPANQIPFKQQLFGPNDITYLTRDLNQTHKVENFSHDVCLTMQCYQYEANDQEHYGNFQIIKNHDLEQTHPANPKSDMDFKDFLNQMHEEWISTYAKEVRL